SELLGAIELCAELTDDAVERDWLAKVQRATAHSEDPTLRRWWEAVARRDRGALAGLARQIDVARLPPARLARLAGQLAAVAGPEPEVDLMRRGRAGFPPRHLVEHRPREGGPGTPPPPPWRAARPPTPPP